MVDLIGAAESNACVIAYNSEANTLLVTLLHFTEDQWMMLALLLASASTITKPIWEERSLLLAKLESANTKSCRVVWSNRTYRRPRVALSYCH